MIVCSHEGRSLRVNQSPLGPALTLTDKTGYAMMVSLPVSPVLVAAMEVEADRIYWVKALIWIFGPLDKKSLPSR